MFAGLEPPNLNRLEDFFMTTATQAVTGTQFEQLMEGVDAETRKQVEDCIVFFSNDADTSAAAEKIRADKLRTGYNNLVDFMVNNRLNELNPQQTIFLCTGAIGDTITVQAANASKNIDLLPADFYSDLLKSFQDPNPSMRTYPVYSVMEKFILIAKSELLALSMGSTTAKKPCAIPPRTRSA